MREIISATGLGGMEITGRAGRRSGRQNPNRLPEPQPAAGAVSSATARETKAGIRSVGSCESGLPTARCGGKCVDSSERHNRDYDGQGDGLFHDANMGRSRRFSIPSGRPRQESSGKARATRFKRGLAYSAGKMPKPPMPHPAFVTQATCPRMA
jgi:hypothetical protein